LRLRLWLNKKAENEKRKKNEKQMRDEKVAFI
jgi:hypothetical protein